MDDYLENVPLLEVDDEGWPYDRNTSNTKGLDKKKKAKKGGKNKSDSTMVSKKKKGKGKGKGKSDKTAESEATEQDIELQHERDFLVAITGIEKKMVTMAKMRDLCKSRLFKATNKPCMNVLLVVWKLFVMMVCVIMTYVGFELLNTFISFLLIGACKNTRDNSYIDQVVRFDKFEQMTDLDFHHPVTTTARMIISSNVIYAFCAFMFISFPVHKIYCTYFIVNFSQVCCVFMEILINNIHLSDQSKANEENRKHNKQYLEKYVPNSDDPISLSYDLISLWGQCCGIDDKNDFDSLSINASLNKVSAEFNEGDKFRSPLVCCDLNAENTIDVVGLKDCARSIYPTHGKGCYTVLLEYLRNYTQFYTYVVIVVHLVDSVITFIIWILFLDKLKVFFTFLAKLEILFNKLRHQQWMQEDEKNKKIERERLKAMRHLAEVERKNKKKHHHHHHHHHKKHHHHHHHHK